MNYYFELMVVEDGRKGSKKENLRTKRLSHRVQPVTDQSSQMKLAYKQKISPSAGVVSLGKLCTPVPRQARNELGVTRDESSLWFNAIQPLQYSDLSQVVHTHVVAVVLFKRTPANNHWSIKSNETKLQTESIAECTSHCLEHVVHTKVVALLWSKLTPATDH